MEPQRYFLMLSYKGSDYCGWQIQPNDKTVQGEINAVLTKLNRLNPVSCMGCGRTDTGVHATKFYAHFDFMHIENKDIFKYKMNNMLPKDIVIHDLIEVDSDAHARYDATSRTYNYFLSTSKNAFNNEVSLEVNVDLDFEKMNEACDILINYTDFECFSKVKTEVNNFECSVSKAHWKKTKDGFVFVISANRFLRNMVRAIVGTMLEIGEGKIEPKNMIDIIESKSRNEAGKSVLPNGLFLVDIKYDYL
jgi:tRNA pseudouridine38-40 synthase